jgi:hypothetical protein
MNRHSFSGWDKSRVRALSAISLGAAAIGVFTLASAQSAGTVRANDSGFKTSPLSSSGVTSKRNALRTFIWGSAGFPTGASSVTTVGVCSAGFCAANSPVKGLTNLNRVDALRITTTGGGQSVSTNAYHFIPTSPKNNRLVIVHEGHACYLDDGPTSGNADGGIQRTIKALLAAGYSVLGMTMPHLTPPNAVLGDPGDCTGQHDPLFTTFPAGTGNALKFFMNPVALAINSLSASYTDFNMLGLSGGGWTTTVYAALDPRIKKSFPVAGTVPLYLRVEPYSHDLEQFLPAFYGANSPATTGLAGYKDLYLLGGAGSGRRQIQVLNRHDNCCFGEPEHNAGVLGVSFESAVRTYESSVKSAVTLVGSGAFRTIIDEVAPVHMISDYAINQVIVPTLNGSTELATTIRSVWGNNLCLDIPDFGRPPQAHDTLQSYVCHGGVNQGFLPQSDGSIRTQAGNFCLDIPDFGRPPQSGDQPQLYPCTGGVNQRFTFASDGSIRTQWGSNLCLDVPDFGRPPQSNDPIQIYSCTGGSNQKFSVNR